MRSGTLLSAALLACALASVAAAPRTWADDVGEGGACANDDGALDEAAFVIATAPVAGERVVSGFSVAGCSRTFESTVQWRLVARDGAELARGFTQGGGVDGPGPFGFQVAYSLDARSLAHLEVFEEDASDGEGPPPGRTVLPLVLLP